MNNSSAQNITSLPIVYYPTWAAVSMVVGGVVGTLGNILILVAITFDKSLRSKCHALMATLAVADVVTCIYLIQNRVLILLSYFNVNNHHCFIISCYGLIAQNLQSALGFSIGLDRFLAVFVPVSYLTWPPVSYVLIVLIPSFAYTIALTAYGYSQTDENKIVGYCFTPTAFNGEASTVWIGSNGVIVILVIVIYSATAILLRNSTHASTAGGKRIIGSLQTIIAVYCITWAATIFANFLLKTVPVAPAVVNVIQMVLSWLVIINSGCNFAIYAWRSSDFRAAFAKILRIKTKQQNTVFAASTGSNARKTTVVSFRKVSFIQVQHPSLVGMQDD